MTNLRVPESDLHPNGSRETDRSSGPKMRGKEREKKRYVGLSYTETQHKQLYLAATHRNKKLSQNLSLHHRRYHMRAHASCSIAR